jgi:hypothetical protein
MAHPETHPVTHCAIGACAKGFLVNGERPALSGAQLETRDATIRILFQAFAGRSKNSVKLAGCSEKMSHSETSATDGAGSRRRLPADRLRSAGKSERLIKLTRVTSAEIEPL